MGKVKLILGFALLAFAIVVTWQIASCELANLELQGDLRDLSAQVGARIGLVPLSSDDDLRGAVIRAAQKHEIQLAPQQVTVQRTGLAESPTIFLAADYHVRVTLPGCSLTFHFNPSSAK